MNGIINVYKPLGISSFDVVRQVRRLCKIKKVGHTGTLDPLAEGVLPICIGKATKLVDYIMSENKVYETALMLGIVTETYDREGSIISETAVSSNTEEIKEAIYQFVGESYQLPPMYSAIKVNGKRLYELARKGIEIGRDKRHIIIHNIDITKIDLPIINFTVCCSKGTYIRSLCYDIGHSLGCGGTMWNLTRTSTGQFNKENSVKLSELNEDNILDYLIPMDKVLEKYSKITIEDKHMKLLLNGGPIKDETIYNNNLSNEFELYRIYNEEGGFLGLGKFIDESLKMEKLLI
ncbi:MAG TPA: tRNA pseudouridine(55) synthase TruB [Clostridiaceae bacterium]